MIIRHADINDASKLSYLEKSLFTNDNYPLSYNSFRYHIKNNLLFVTEIDDKIVAYILVLIKRKKAKIYSIGVLKENRGQKISSKLLKQALNELAILKFQSVILEVRTDNINAIKLYEKFGFVITKSVVSFYRDGCDAYLMELEYVDHKMVRPT